MVKTGLHKKAGYTGAPRLRLPKKAPMEPEKDITNPYHMSPRHQFLIFMYMDVPVARWVYLLYLAFGEKESQLRDFAKVYPAYKLTSLAITLIIPGIPVYIGLDLVDKLLAYMKML